MSQYGQFSGTFQDRSGNAYNAASVSIYREGAWVNGAQSGTSPIVVTVADRGSIASGDTVFIGTAYTTTYAVTATTATTLTLSGFSGTLVLANGARIVPTNTPPALYGDDVGATTLTNPLSTDGNGFAQAYLLLGINDTINDPISIDVLLYGAGVTTLLRQVQLWPAPPVLGNIRWAHQWNTATSETGGIQEAINSIGDASATNPYTVMLRPGIYDVDRGKAAGTQTGTADFTTNGVTVTGTGTKFKSTQALTGTVTMTAATAAVTGSGTLFTTELQIGDYIQMNVDADDGAGADVSGLFGRVVSIESATALTLEIVGEAIYGGAGGTGAARFREFRVGDHIKAGTHATTAYTRITSIASDTSLTISGVEAIPILTGYQGATATGAAITKATYYQTGVVLYGLKANGGWNTGLDAKDYITVVGMDRDSCIIRRQKAAGQLTGVVQGIDNTSLSNLTIWSNGTRHVHWDQAANSTSLRMHNNRFKGSNGGLSAGASLPPGATSDCIVVLTSNIVDGQFAIHDSATVSATYGVKIFVVGNVFNGTGTIMGFSFLTNAGEQYLLHIAGNIQPYYNVDSGAGSIDLQMPTTVANGANISIFTDGVLRIHDTNSPPAVTNDTTTYLFNTLAYPMERTGYQCVSGVQSGDVMVYRVATADLNTTTTANAQWPTVACNQNDTAATANWFPRLCTGPYGACFVESAQAVTPGDTLVTSVTAKDAFVNNAQTDMTRVIGWAFSGKTAGARRLVAFRRNMMLNW